MRQPLRMGRRSARLRSFRRQFPKWSGLSLRLNWRSDQSLRYWRGATGRGPEKRLRQPATHRCQSCGASREAEHRTRRHGGGCVTRRFRQPIARGFSLRPSARVRPRASLLRAVDQQEPQAPLCLPDAGAARRPCASEVRPRRARNRHVPILIRGFPTGARP